MIRLTLLSCEERSKCGFQSQMTKTLMLMFKRLLFLYNEEQIFVFHPIFKPLNMSDCMHRETLEKRSRKCTYILWFYFVFWARVLSPMLPWEPGSEDVTNTGLFTALPSLVGTLLRAEQNCQGRSVALLTLRDGGRVLGELPPAHCLYAPIDICLQIIFQPVYLQTHPKSPGLLHTELLPNTTLTGKQPGRPRSQEALLEPCATTLSPRSCVPAIWMGFQVVGIYGFDEKRKHITGKL